jgi:hypothetical protein
LSLITVTIIGVLAAIGSYAYGRLTKRSCTTQAITFFAAVPVPRRRITIWRPPGATDTASPFDAWDPAHDIEDNAHNNWPSDALPAWQQIGVALPRNTWFAYVVVAGDPDDLTCDPPPAVPTQDGGTEAIPACGSITPGSFWYYIIGRADQDGDTFTSCFGSSSTMSGTHWSIEGLDLE